MCFVTSLMNCFFASGAFFIIFAILTFAQSMGCKAWNLDSLFTLITDIEHRTSVKKMKVPVILILEFFIESFTKFTCIFRVGNIFGRWDVNELILSLLELLMFLMLYGNLLRFFVMSRDWFFIEASIIFTLNLNLFLYWFQDLRA